MKLVFMGTPDFAVPSLKKLIEAPDIELLAVLTQPDKAVGRKQIITPPPIKILALENKLEVYQPDKLNKDEELIKKLKDWKPDFLITVAYGQIIREEILAIAPIVNLHASILPKFRGPAPINWMIIHGEKIVGVSTMLTDAGVDTGDILLKAETELGENERAAELSERLAELGADLLLKTLQDFKSIKPEKQSDEVTEKTLAPFMDKKLGEIDFAATEIVLGSANPRQSDFQLIKKNSAENIHNLVRATYPWPGAYFEFKGEKVIVLRTELGGDVQSDPGEIVSINKDGSFDIATQEGVLKILELKPQGRKAQKASDWLNGQRLQAGDSLNGLGAAS